MPRPYGGACGAAAALTGSEGRRVCEQDGRQWRDRAGLVFGAFRRHLRSSLLVFLTALLNHFRPCRPETATQRHYTASCTLSAPSCVVAMLGSTCMREVSIELRNSIFRHSRMPSTPLCKQPPKNPPPVDCCPNLFGPSARPLRDLSIGVTWSPIGEGPRLLANR